jgi:hypothetical protein
MTHYTLHCQSRIWVHGQHAKQDRYLVISCPNHQEDAAYLELVHVCVSKDRNLTILP